MEGTMKKDEAIRKIKKMLAIADDPTASDQEIQLAVYRANKLRIEHKIEEIELFDKKNTVDDVISVRMERSGVGYIHWVLNVLCHAFQCETSYGGTINRNNVTFSIIGLKYDVELCKPVAEGLVYYLNTMLEDLKNCYIGEVDFRIYRREYLRGFSNGLNEKLKQSLIEMNIDPKYELAVVGVPAVVKEWVDEKVKVRVARCEKEDRGAYELGRKHGYDYDINRKNLIEAKKL